MTDAPPIVHVSYDSMTYDMLVKQQRETQIVNQSSKPSTPVQRIFSDVFGLGFLYVASFVACNLIQQLARNKRSRLYDMFWGPWYYITGAPVTSWFEWVHNHEIPADTGPEQCAQIASYNRQACRAAAIRAHWHNPIALSSAWAVCDSVYNQAVAACGQHGTGNKTGCYNCQMQAQEQLESCFTKYADDPVAQAACFDEANAAAAACLTEYKDCGEGPPPGTLSPCEVCYESVGDAYKQCLAEGGSAHGCQLTARVGAIDCIETYGRQYPGCTAYNAPPPPI